MRPISKPSRKLTLDRATVRSLDADQLKRAVGGFGVQGPNPAATGDIKAACKPPLVVE